MRTFAGEFPVMNNLNSLLNQHQINNHGQLSSSPYFDPTSSNDDFLEQILSSVPPSAAASFPWADDQSPALLCHLGEHHSMEAKMRHHQIGSNAAAAKALMMQQQLFSRNLAAANGFRSPAGDDDGLLSIPEDDHSDAVDGHSFNSANPANDASVKCLFNGFTGSLGQTANETHHFHQTQTQNFEGSAAAAVSQPATSGGGAAGQTRQKVRARRGQATDPHSIAERLRRERIAERMKGLQELVPNANKTDKASMLDEIIDYVKFLQLQVKVLSMSRLGGAGAGALAPLVAADTSSEGRSGNRTTTQTAASSSTNNNEGMTVAEHQVAKLMEDDMGSAMQYLQGKGLCLMPISLATAISTATCHSRNPALPSPSANHPLLNGGDAAGPISPTMSVLTVQSTTVDGGEPSSKP